MIERFLNRVEAENAESFLVNTDSGVKPEKCALSKIRDQLCSFANPLIHFEVCLERPLS